MKLTATEGKARIIEAAKRVISRCGIEGATMRGIAEEAEVSTGAIYYYYKSKEEVLYDVMAESLSASTRIATMSRQTEASRDQIIEEIGLNIQQRFHKNDDNRLQFYLAYEAMIGNDELKIKFKEKYAEWIDRTEELMRYLYNRTPTKYDQAFATLLIGAIDGVVMQILLNANPAEIDQITEVYSHILKFGIPKFLDYLGQQ